MTAAPVLPSRDDPELASLMSAAASLTRGELLSNLRCLLRGALGHERTGCTGVLEDLAAGALLSHRLRRDNPGAYPIPAGGPAAAGDLQDVEDVLAAHGMTS